MSSRSWAAPNSQWQSPVSSPRKRLLTESEPDVPDSRRKDPKASRACDRCKTKKIRCSGTLPCATCSKMRVTCAYASKYARGRPPTPLPPVTQDLESDSPALSDVAQSSEAQRESSSHPPPLIPNDRGDPSSSVSRASPELEIEGQYFDPTSGLTFLHRARKKLFAQTREMASQAPNEAEKHQLLTCAGDRPFYLDEQHSNPLIPDSSSSTRTLLSFYFDTCVVTYRMFHRQTVENWLDTLLKDREQNRQISHTLGNARCAIVLTLLAIARFRGEKVQCGYFDYSEDRDAAALCQSDSMYCAAMNLTDLETGFPRLESAQARLIQVLYLLQTSRMNKAWYTFGNALHVISSLGLHRRRSRKQSVSFKSMGSDFITLQCAKRTFWVAYTIDKYLSVVFKRPQLLHDEDIDQDFPESVNDEDMKPFGPVVSEASEDCHTDSLIFHAKIARIIGRISRQAYATGDIRTADRVVAARRLVDELHQWRANLPSHLGTVKPSTLMPSFRRESSALNLAYYHAIIHANRPFLLGDENTDAPDVKDRVADCISAAKMALELVNSMAKDTNLFHSFWWTNYVTFCALAVVYVWEIQRNSNNNKHNKDGNNRKNDDDPSYEKLFDLAEKTKSHLLRASSAASPSRRYGIILEELRLEAHQQQNARNNATYSLQTVQSTENTSSVLRLDFTDGGGAELLEAAPECFVGPDNSTGGDDILNITLNTWQPTDWLELDSSVFYPLLDVCDETRSSWL